MNTFLNCRYLSHVPHNLSTLKLLNPKTSYASHFQTLMNNAINARFPTENTIHQTPLLKRVVGLGLGTHVSNG